MNAIFSILLFLNVSGLETIQADIIRLDQAFIPVWYHSQLGNVDEALQANLVLQYEWKAFQSKYEDISPVNFEWQDAFGRINAWLDQVSCDLEDKDLSFAFIHLEHAKYELISFHQKFGFHYFLDDLHDFHESLAYLQEIINDDQLCLLEWNEFEDLVKLAFENWKTLFPINTHQYAALPDPMKQLNVDFYTNILSQELSTIQKLMVEANQKPLQGPISALDEISLEIIACFGDFNTLLLK